MHRIQQWLKNKKHHRPYPMVLYKEGIFHKEKLFYLVQNATAIAPGPACVPTTLPTKL